MKERPILFKAEMVRAILGGRKTMTRRIVKEKDINCPYGEPGDRLWVRETWRLSGKDGVYLYRADNQCEVDKWKPSIFMPRSVSRILLEITDVRVERLKEITERDAQSEGLNPHDYFYDTTVYAFIDLWQSINGPDSWNENPYVWVIEFKMV